MNARFRSIAAVVAISFAALLVGCGPTYEADSTDADDTAVAAAEGASDEDAADNEKEADGAKEDEASSEKAEEGAAHKEDEAQGEDLAREGANGKEEIGDAEEAGKTGKKEDDAHQDQADELADDLSDEASEEPKLTIGSKAPELKIADWVTGDPIKALEADKVHVVEFWATWCGPCRATMPHLSKLQEEYGDVKFVGITDEDRDTVEGFLGEEQEAGKLWKEVITYRLAIDEDQATNKAYMMAAGEQGIPTAFIVGRDGNIEWIGHPASMDEPLKKIVAGEWDRDAAIAERATAAKMNALASDLQNLFQGGKWDEALAKLDEFEKASGASAQVTMFRMAILQAAGRPMDAAAQVTKLIDQSWDNAMGLNEIAWGIAIGKSIGNMEQAERAAIRAAELTSHSEASILDTLARVYYEKGDLDKAIEWQQKAVDKNSSSNPDIAAALTKYQDEKAGKSSEEAAPKEGEEPTEDEPATEEKTEAEPATEEPATDEPATAEPVVEEPAAEEPTTP